MSKIRAPRLYEHVTLTCQNEDCPRPHRLFRVPIRQIGREYCSRSCYRVGIQSAHLARLRENPPMTDEQFDECARQFSRITPALKAAARQVLVGGNMATSVARVTGCCQQSLSRVVGKYLRALCDAQKDDK